MASSSEPYTFQRASTMATRSLVSDDNPTQIPSLSSNDGDFEKPTMQRRTTNNYEQAAAARNNAAGVTEAAALEKPALDRQQSWSLSDMKRQAMDKVLSMGNGGSGYSSTQDQ